MKAQIDTEKNAREVLNVRARRSIWDADDAVWDAMPCEQMTHEEENELDDIFQKLKEFTCSKIGHEFVKDHCGIPEHDYCVLCNNGRDA